MSISSASEVQLSVIRLIAGSGSTLSRQGGYKRKTRWQEGWEMGGGGRLFPFKGAYLITYSWSDYFSLFKQ